LVQSCSQKESPFRSTQIKFRTAAVPPSEGRIAIVTDAGWDAVDAAASGAIGNRWAGLSVSDRPARGTNDASTPSLKFGGQHMVL
jgi:hypothetical protein